MLIKENGPTYSLMGSRQQPKSYGLQGNSLRGCHKAFQGGCGLYVDSACEPK